MEHRGSHITSLLFIFLLVTVAVGMEVWLTLSQSQPKKVLICAARHNRKDWPPAKRHLCGIGIYINSDNADALAYLPEIGPKRAMAIVTYRRKHGPFHRISELSNVPGIGPHTLKRIRPWIEMDGIKL